MIQQLDCKPLFKQLHDINYGSRAKVSIIRIRCLALYFRTQKNIFLKKDPRIRKIGRIHYPNEDGFFINPLKIEDIQEEYKTVLDAILKGYESHFEDTTHSIYIRGSVAKGMAVPYISDVDTIAISHLEISREMKELRSPIINNIIQKNPFVNGIEMHFIPKKELLEKEHLQFLLKTQCLCIKGENLNLILPEFKMGRAAYAHTSTLKADIQEIKEYFTQENQEEETIDICSWIMKRIVRTGFELIMEKENSHTRDLYPCYELFSKHYPVYKSEMYEALVLSIYPTDNIQKIINTIESLEGILLEETGKIIAKWET